MVTIDPGGDYSSYETLRWGLANSVNVIAGRLTISDMAPPYQVVKFAKEWEFNLIRMLILQ